ncbi:hypothetical protein NL676_010678 [Syzygium grande]|nr:hypothetical protein NL676_010678 [Syzygium grande]
MEGIRQEPLSPNSESLCSHPDGSFRESGLLCFDLIEEWTKDNPTAFICTSDGVGKFKDVAIFQDYHGLLEFRQAVAKFMGRVRRGKATFDPNRIFMSGGAMGVSETLIFCLADPGDAFLVPSPYYPAEGFMLPSRLLLYILFYPEMDHKDGKGIQPMRRFFLEVKLYRLVSVSLLKVILSGFDGFVKITPFTLMLASEEPW